MRWLVIVIRPYSFFIYLYSLVQFPQAKSEECFLLIKTGPLNLFIFFNSVKINFQHDIYVGTKLTVEFHFTKHHLIRRYVPEYF